MAFNYLTAMKVIKIKIQIILKWMHLLIIYLSLGWLDFFTVRTKEEEEEFTSFL